MKMLLNFVGSIVNAFGSAYPEEAFSNTMHRALVGLNFSLEDFWSFFGRNSRFSLRSISSSSSSRQQKDFHFPFLQSLMNGVFRHKTTLDNSSYSFDWSKLPVYTWKQIHSLPEASTVKLWRILYLLTS